MKIENHYYYLYSLKTKSITKVGAGDGFSVFASDNGIVMTCGDGTLGCLGKNCLTSSYVRM